MYEKSETLKSKDQEMEKLTFKDFIAICLAQYSILIPLGIGVLFIYFILMVLITKVWF